MFNMNKSVQVVVLVFDRSCCNQFPDLEIQTEGNMQINSSSQYLASNVYTKRAPNAIKFYELHGRHRNLSLGPKIRGFSTYRAFRCVTRLSFIWCKFALVVEVVGLRSLTRRYSVILIPENSSYAKKKNYLHPLIFAWRLIYFLRRFGYVFFHIIRYLVITDTYFSIVISFRQNELALCGSVPITERFLSLSRDLGSL